MAGPHVEPFIALPFFHFFSRETRRRFGAFRVQVQVRDSLECSVLFSGSPSES